MGGLSAASPQPCGIVGSSCSPGGGIRSLRYLTHPPARRAAPFKGFPFPSSNTMRSPDKRWYLSVAAPWGRASADDPSPAVLLRAQAGGLRHCATRGSPALLLVASHLQLDSRGPAGDREAAVGPLALLEPNRSSPLRRSARWLSTPSGRVPGPGIRFAASLTLDSGGPALSSR